MHLIPDKCGCDAKLLRWNLTLTASFAFFRLGPLPRRASRLSVVVRGAQFISDAVTFDCLCLCIRWLTRRQSFFAVYFR